MAFVRVGALSRLAPGTVMEAVHGDQRYAVCNIGGTVHALGGICPHRGGPLGQGAVNGELLTCPWHAWEFDCGTGQNDYDPRCTVPIYPVKVSGDDILIDLP